MILKYGNYAHAVGEAAIVISVSALYTQQQVHYANRERWEISGFLQGASAAALTAAINAMKAAYALPGQDVGLYLDDGVTLTSHYLRSRDSIGGVRVVGGPSFPEGRGAEYATFRSYRIILEADTIAIELTGVPLAWEEVLTFTGGGPRFLYLQTLTGLPQKQIVAAATSYRVAQIGHALAIASYPLPSAPIWPMAEHVEQRQISRKAPVMVNGQLQYETTWQYLFESGSPLAGDPTLA